MSVTVNVPLANGSSNSIANGLTINVGSHAQTAGAAVSGLQEAGRALYTHGVTTPNPTEGMNKQTAEGAKKTLSSTGKRVRKAKGEPQSADTAKVRHDLFKAVELIAERRGMSTADVLTEVLGTVSGEQRAKQNWNRFQKWIGDFGREDMLRRIDTAATLPELRAKKPGEKHWDYVGEVVSPFYRALKNGDPGGFAKVMEPINEHYDNKIKPVADIITLMREEQRFQEQRSIRLAQNDIYTVTFIAHPDPKAAILPATGSPVALASMVRAVTLIAAGATGDDFSVLYGSAVRTSDPKNRATAAASANQKMAATFGLAVDTAGDGQDTTVTKDAPAASIPAFKAVDTSSPVVSHTALTLTDRRRATVDTLLMTISHELQQISADSYDEWLGVTAAGSTMLFHNLFDFLHRQKVVVRGWPKDALSLIDGVATECSTPEYVQVLLGSLKDTSLWHKTQLDALDTSMAGDHIKLQLRPEAQLLAS
ncbi:hypothetical protein V8E36_003889 [Tilletia maclaganii]